MLFRIGAGPCDGIALFHIWQHLVLIGVIINSHVTVKFDLASIGSEDDAILSQTNIHGVKDGSCHLAGHKAVPDKGIELELILVQILGNRVRCQLDIGRTDGLVGILSSRNIFNPTAMLGILFAKLVCDKVCRLGLGNRADTGRIRTHIGNQTLSSTCSKTDSFVELLGHHHGLTGSEIELIGRVHLHG